MSLRILPTVTVDCDNSVIEITLVPEGFAGLVSISTEDFVNEVTALARREDHPKLIIYGDKIPSDSIEPLIVVFYQLRGLGWSIVTELDYTWNEIISLTGEKNPRNSFLLSTLIIYYTDEYVEKSTGMRIDVWKSIKKDKKILCRRSFLDRIKSWLGRK